MTPPIHIETGYVLLLIDKKIKGMKKMKLASDVLVMMVALEALFIMILEMFLTQTKMARKAFDLSQEYLAQKQTRVSMANQGLYNGFIGVGIILSRFLLPTGIRMFNLYLFVGFVVIAAIYGAITANKKIIISQGLPAMIAWVSLFIANH
ncbi:integral membrane protein [Lactiplantibacillus plantarum]|nr:integral membrane protein [Lactiplantibacillus plantarum]